MMNDMLCTLVLSFLLVFLFNLFLTIFFYSFTLGSWRKARTKKKKSSKPNPFRVWKFYSANDWTQIRWWISKVRLISGCYQNILLEFNPALLYIVCKQYIHFIIQVNIFFKCTWTDDAIFVRSIKTICRSWLHRWRWKVFLGIWRSSCKFHFWKTK